MIAKIAGESYVNPNRLMLETFSPNAIEQGTGGVASTLFIGQAYIVGGIPMVIFSTFLTVGILYFFYYIFTTKLRRTPLTITIYASIIIYVIKSLGGGFFTSILVSWKYIFFIALIIISIIIRGSVIPGKKNW